MVCVKFSNTQILKPVAFLLPIPAIPHKPVLKVFVTMYSSTATLPSIEAIVTLYDTNIVHTTPMFVLGIFIFEGGVGLG